MASSPSSIVSSRHLAILAVSVLVVAYLGYRYQPDQFFDLFPAPDSAFIDVVVFIICVTCFSFGLKSGSSAQVSDTVRRCLPEVFVGGKGSCTNKSSKSKGLYTVCLPSVTDVTGLRQLYKEDYVQAHMWMHPGVRGASFSDWEEALGPVDFDTVIQTQCKARGDVRLLKCVEVVGSVSPEEQLPMGYILYELRAKGSPTKKPQRYCEVVNVVVAKKHQGSGLGRLLFEEMVTDIEKNTKQYSGDLRLFVAKANVRPLEWYKRLGFEDAGWQKENLGKTEVPFLRMTRKAPLKKV